MPPAQQRAGKLWVRQSLVKEIFYAFFIFEKGKLKEKHQPEIDIFIYYDTWMASGIDNAG